MNDLKIDSVSNVINEELEQIENYIKNNIKINSNEEIIKDNKINNNFIQIKERINEVKKEILYKNKINIRLNVQSKGNYNIFGQDFVKNNKDNINLMINGKPSFLVTTYELNEGDNMISISVNIKKTIINLSYMFYMCESLKDINELKYLNVDKVLDISYMFFGCSRLSDINPLKH